MRACRGVPIWGEVFCKPSSGISMHFERPHFLASTPCSRSAWSHWPSAFSCCCGGANGGGHPRPGPQTGAIPNAIHSFPQDDPGVRVVWIPLRFSCLPRLMGKSAQFNPSSWILHCGTRVEYLQFALFFVYFLPILKCSLEIILMAESGG